MTQPTSPKKRYRKAAGVVVFNYHGEVWLGRRRGGGKYSWQFPQGGLDKGESAEAGALRELEEETNIRAHWLTPLGEIDDWLYYDLPGGRTMRRRGKDFVGQRQKWFAYRYEGDEAEIDVKAHKPPEFTRWRWGKLEETPGLIVPFKRKVYERIVDEFRVFTQPVSSE